MAAAPEARKVTRPAAAQCAVHCRSAAQAWRPMASDGTPQAGRRVSAGISIDVTTMVSRGAKQSSTMKCQHGHRVNPVKVNRRSQVGRCGRRVELAIEAPRRRWACSRFRIWPASCGDVALYCLQVCVATCLPPIRLGVGPESACCHATRQRRMSVSRTRRLRNSCRARPHHFQELIRSPPWLPARNGLVPPARGATAAAAPALLRRRCHRLPAPPSCRWCSCWAATL